MITDAHKRFWTIGRKIALTVSIGLGVACRVLAYQSMSQRDLVLETVDNNRLAIADMIAAQAVGGVKFKKEQAIAKVYTRYLESDASALSAITVYGIDDAVLSSGVHATAAPVDLNALMPEAKPKVEEGKIFIRKGPTASSRSSRSWMARRARRGASVTWPWPGPTTHCSRRSAAICGSASRFPPPLPAR